jgi:hypothetical protein
VTARILHTRRSRRCEEADEEGSYKVSASDGAFAAVTSDEAISLFSEELPRGHNGGTREINSTLPGSMFEKISVISVSSC